MPATIIGLGSALPNNSVTQTDSLLMAKDLCCRTERQERVLELVYEKSGVHSRSTVLHAAVKPAAEKNFFQPPTTTRDAGPSTAQRMALYQEQAGPLANAACVSALQQNGISAEQITHLVTVSCTGFVAPGFDLHLFKSLSLNPAVRRTHVGFMGCHGALNGLRVASGFCCEDPKNIVLLCATELCSMHFQYGWSKEILVSNSLFADGSAAVLLTGESGKLSYSDAASYVVPDTEAAMSWRIGDTGFTMSLASSVPDLIETNLPVFMHSWLAKNDLTVQDIKGWAVHPGGPRILDAVSDALELPPQALSVSRQILYECGNMSSPTVLFILQRLIAVGNSLPCVVLGFGPGLTIEAALIR